MMQPEPQLEPQPQPEPQLPLEEKVVKMDPSLKRNANNVRVFLRVRPLNERETREGSQEILEYDYADNVVLLKKPTEKCNGKDTDNKYFKLDHIFFPDSAQVEVYRLAAAPLVEQVFDGYNATIFAYGQTGTGKTYTMTGSHDMPEQRGIIPNTFTHIFSQIANSTEEKSFIVKVMYLEIYNEEVRDLLGEDPNKKLQIKERHDIGIYVKDLSGFTVDSVESITQLMDRGNKNRITRSTMMNDLSSRSHAVFTIVIESKNRETNKTTVGKLNLVDLAGSERITKTGVTGMGLREAGNINQSLLTLSTVIQALVEHKTFIPYRNSKLTRLLQDSLGGNSKTTMIAMVGPSDQDYEETYSTLRYAYKAKYIKNFAKVNIEKRGLIERFEEEIAELQKKLVLLSAVSDQAIQDKSEKKKARSAADIEKLRRAEHEIEKVAGEKHTLNERIATLQKKIICGGENLLEKAHQQELMLFTSVKELENLDRARQQLVDYYSKVWDDKVDLEEKYNSLQEEDIALSKKIRTVQQRIKDSKEEYADKEHEYQREMEALNDNNRLLVREMQLSSLMIDYYIPPEYKNKKDEIENLGAIKRILFRSEHPELDDDKFEELFYGDIEYQSEYDSIADVHSAEHYELEVVKRYCDFNQDTQEFQLRGVAYSGNNMRKRQTASNETPAVQFDQKPSYHKYPEKKRVSKETEIVKSYCRRVEEENQPSRLEVLCIRVGYTLLFFLVTCLLLYVFFHILLFGFFMTSSEDPWWEKPGLY